MKFFSKPKQKGTTLVISLIVSFLVLGLAMTVLESVDRTLEEAQNLQRGDQVFYGAESGMEAAFFHHNSRGAGVDFGELTQPSFPESLKIAHDASNIDVQWTIDGRAESNMDGAATISGLLHRDEHIQIPLFWDGAENPSEPTSKTGLNIVTDGFVLYLARPEFDYNNTLQPLTTPANDPLVAWGLIRVHDTEGIQTLIPITDSNNSPCGTSATFVCDLGLPAQNITFGNKSMAGNVYFSHNATLPPSNSNGITGQIVPPPQTMATEMTWDEFLMVQPDVDRNSYVLTLQGLGTFKREDLDNYGNEMAIEGVPFILKASGMSGEIPRTEYVVKARVQQGDFEKLIETRVRERSSTGVFNYVVFD